ncbi:MAG: FeoA family protein [Syntrophomonadaceae bacterium]|nr:FeoA family protein [Syntrophomonadaceae bacterium]
MESLTALKTGEAGIVEKVTGGRSFVSRASAMGFTSNVELTMLQNFARGPLLVFLRDSQIALGRGEAEKIKVRRK